MADQIQSYFPLRWESTGDQWWYASPIDWAAANGHYDVVRELLHLDTNLLIKLTSLRRIRRLESLWDDDERFIDVARCRSSVARSLLMECEGKDGVNTLIKAGYAGWLLYTASSAGDVSFTQDLLDRDPLIVFGEGEYGLTDILYAASRGRNKQLFKTLLDYALNPRGGSTAGDGADVAVFKAEVANRAVHAAARGGDLEMLKDLLKDCDDVLVYRDVNGSTVLHAASSTGQVEVVDFLINSFAIINAKDNQGNTALHIAAFTGHLHVVKTLISFSPSIILCANNSGDTFLHTAVSGFRTPGFKRLDKQMNLMKSIINDMNEIINVRNNQGKTALHLAVMGNFECDLVELFLTVGSVNLNVKDTDGMTPLDLLKQRPKSPSSEILIKQLVTAGGISNLNNVRSFVGSNFRMGGFGTSPGTSFKISDAEIFLYTGVSINGKGIQSGGRPSNCSSKGETSFLLERRPSSLDKATQKIKSLIKWPSHIKEKKKNHNNNNNNTNPIGVLYTGSMDSLRKLNECGETPTPLRQRFSKASSLPNNKRTLAVRTSTPGPASKKKLTNGLLQGVMQAMPHLVPESKSSSNDTKQKGVMSVDGTGASCSSSFETKEQSPRERPSLGRNKVMNFCFGAQGLAMEDPVTGKKTNRMFKRSVTTSA
ncbi:hypothetical protein LUZ60_004489 [Juncus effusus]|nr:hypothetical protein LUZ60_004489 [Juncus effusus]